MTEAYTHFPMSVLAASCLGPSLSLDEDLPWREAAMPLGCDELVQKMIGQPMRRTGRFIKLVCAGAMACIKQVPPQILQEKKTGIFLATGLGNSAEILPFVTQVFKHDGGFPSPNQFANSVSNAAAFFLARFCGVKGVVLTISDEERSFESALWLAQCYLESGEIDLALVGGCDVFTPTLLEYRDRMNLLADNARDCSVGEGSSWFLLGPETPNKMGDILAVCLDLKKMTPQAYLQSEKNPALCAAVRDARKRLWLPGFRIKNPDAPDGMETYDYLTHCGIHPTASAFGLAHAMRRQSSSLLIHYQHSASGKPAMIAAKTT